MLIHRRTIWLLATSCMLLLPTIVRGQLHDITPQNSRLAPPKYAYGNAPYSTPNPGAKAAHQPFAPVQFDHDWQPFAPADISEYGNGPHRRYGVFASYERLYWGISKPPAQTIGSTSAEGMYWQPAGDPQLQNRIHRNSFDTGMFNGDFAWGNRYDLGYIDMDNNGWLVSILSNLSQNQTYISSGGAVLFDDPFEYLVNYTDINGDGFDDDRNMNGIFGRDGIDTDGDGEPDFYNFPPDEEDESVGPIDPDDRVRFLPRFDATKITNRVEFNGVELMRTARIPRFHDGSDLELLFGVRYLQVKDRFTFLGVGGPLDATFMNTTIQNNIVGPQIGFRWSLKRQRWVTSAEGRFMAGFNFQSGNQLWTVASNIDEVPTQNGPSIANYSVRSESTSDTFAPAGELRVQTTYYLTKAIGLKIGYSLLYVDGIQRASDSVVYELPNFGITTKNNDGYILTNGVNFGIEINR